MPSAFDSLKRASFDGNEFPYDSLETVGGIRDHVHEYPHADGGAPEKLGRKLYTWKFRANFHATFQSYPNLWPGTINTLIGLFESSRTKQLVVPTRGKFDAYCVNWSIHTENRIRSGEKADIEFREDLAQTFLTASLTVTTALTALGPSASLLAAQLDAQRAGMSANDQSLFDKVKNAATAVFAVADGAALYGNQLESKLRSLDQIIQQADRLPVTLSATGANLADALRQVWADTRKLLNDLQGKEGGGLQSFTVPVTMSVAQVSAAIFGGDATHGQDLMQLNALTDGYRVQAGTVIRYYPAS